MANAVGYVCAYLLILCFSLFLVLFTASKTDYFLVNYTFDITSLKHGTSLSVFSANNNSILNDTTSCISTFDHILPVFGFLNWIALAPAFFLVFTLAPVPISSLIVSLVISNYLFLIVFLSVALDCHSLLNVYSIFLYRHWIPLLSASVLICVLGGLIYGLSINGYPGSLPTKLKKRRFKKGSLYTNATDEREFFVDVDVLENEMIVLKNFSNPSLCFPSREVNPSYLTRLPVWRFSLPRRCTDIHTCSSATSEYDSSADDGIVGKDYTLSDECSICLEQYSVGDEITALSCYHAFHVQCVLTWIVGRDKHRCPICRWPSFIKKEQLYSVLASYNA